MRITFEDLEKRYSEMTAHVQCVCEAVTPFVGGMSASDTGLRAFVKHHLSIEDPEEAEKAFQRIKKEELGERDIAPETGELKEQLTYGINVLRRTEIGPYLGNHMIHANIKVAMSRLQIFSELRGTKGNVAESGLVTPFGISKLDDRMDCVYLIGPDGQPATTYFDEFKGRVQTPKGSVSIIHHSECVPPGTRFAYQFNYLRGKLSDKDIVDTLAMSMIAGLGSCKALGNGKFRIVDAEILEPTSERKPKNAKKEKEKQEAIA